MASICRRRRHLSSSRYHSNRSDLGARRDTYSRLTEPTVDRYKARALGVGPPPPPPQLYPPRICVALRCRSVMGRSDPMSFPSAGMHALSATIHLLGVTILAHLISRRAILRGNLTLRDTSWPWKCVLLIFVDSWLFIFTSGVLILGFGLEQNDVSCSMGILLCIIFYGTSKLFIYIFLCSSSHPCV